MYFNLLESWFTFIRVYLPQRLKDKGFARLTRSEHTKCLFVRSELHNQNEKMISAFEKEIISRGITELDLQESGIRLTATYSIKGASQWAMQETKRSVYIDVDDGFRWRAPNQYNTQPLKFFLDRVEFADTRKMKALMLATCKRYDEGRYA